jgi:hypothetical protein
MNQLEVKETRNSLFDYVWSKYNPADGFWHDTFFKGNPLTQQEVEDAVDTFVNKCMNVYGDVMCENGDTECVRDIILLRRGVDYTDLVCGLWVRHHIEEKPVGVVEYREKFRKDKEEEYNSFKQTHPGYFIHNTFREYWLGEWDAHCMLGFVDMFFHKLNNRNR